MNQEIESPRARFSLRTWPYRSVIPNTFTFLGLCLTFIAINFVLVGDYISACWLFFYTTGCDLLDGAVARLLDAGSSLGKEIDSFADLVNCGLMPALLIYQVFLKDWGIAGLALSCCWLVFVAIRLGRFSASSSHKQDYFSGMPVPIGATLVAGYIIFCNSVWGEYRYPWLVAVFIPPLCWLMLSKLRFPKSYFMSPRRILRTWQGWGALVIILLIALAPNWIVTMPLMFLGSALITLGISRLKTPA